MGRAFFCGWNTSEFASLVYSTAKMIDCDETTVFDITQKIVAELLAESSVPDAVLADFAGKNINSMSTHFRRIRALESDDIKEDIAAHATAVAREPAITADSTPESIELDL